MILLLNNVHCPCGRRKELLDLKKGYGSFHAKLRTNGNARSYIFKKKNSYQSTINQLIKETSYLFQKHLEDNRSKMDLKNLTICVDAGWSSRRHANECCFIVIDNKTKLLYDIIVITRDVFSGASGNMEAEAAKYFCEKHKEKINLVGVVKDGDTKLAKIFEAAWNRVNILKDSNHLLKNIRKNIQENANLKCIKNNCNKLKKKIYVKVLEAPTELKKELNSSKQWEMRCQFSVLNRELPEWKTILMAQLGLNINLPQIISQAKKNLEKQYEKIRQNTQEYKTGRTKTLNINEGEFNGDIEIFKEVDDNVDTNEFVEENFDKNDLSDDNEMEEIEEILSSNNIISNDLTDDNIFGITFDKRLPSSFTDNTLLFEIERNKKK
ncbi:hypothetical protein M0813_19918 [Anaeramoeba flamelloides]|uniref:Transposase n=1 Tax=Anaeramoeba flamelloides TaxID=1746091 RepID=A0ABQ8YLG7_9EUKA|nr:hypothetical protein M0813_19918 [Anaeramoeba flamelloides]